MPATRPVARTALAGASAGKGARIASCLCLAASPSFAVMALACTFAGDADPICSAIRGAIPFSGMATMYWLMAVFHLPAWLNWHRHRSRR